MDRLAVMKRLEGCFLALPTLHREDLSLNPEGMRQHVNFLLDNGLRVGNATLLVNGAGGEFPTLSLEERQKTAETVVKAASNRIGIIVGGQALGTHEAVQIAQHAQSIGAAAIQVSPPFYYRLTDDDVYEHTRAIAESAPDLGIVLYNTHWLGYRFSLPMFERLLALPQVVALKWSSPSMFEYQAVLRRFADELVVIDNQLVPVFCRLLGGKGANLHPTLFWPEWGVRLWALLTEERWIEGQAEVDRVLMPYYDILAEISTITGGEGHLDKVGMELIGLPGGHNRPPTRPLPATFKQKLTDFLKRIGAPLERV